MSKIAPFRFKFVGVLLGVFATLMILFPALTYSDTSYTGIQVAFGHEFINLGILGSGQIELSILNAIAYSLPLLAAIFLLYSKKGYLISAIIFGAAAVMMFFIKDFTTVSFTIGNLSNNINIEWAYGIGLTIAGILSALGVLNGIFGMFVQK